jgi:hypothetical protein
MFQVSEIWQKSIDPYDIQYHLGIFSAHFDVYIKGDATKCG